MAAGPEVKRIAVRITAVLVAGVFVYAGVLKALDPARFAVDVQNYRLLPWTACVLVALYLPWLEIVCGGALFVTRFRAAALTLLTGMMLVFIAALLSAKLRGIDIACGCFGSAGEPGEFLETLFRDAVLLAALVFLLLTPRIKSEDAPNSS